jgi:hypothetical protein
MVSGTLVQLAVNALGDGAELVVRVGETVTIW